MPIKIPKANPNKFLVSLLLRFCSLFLIPLFLFSPLISLSLIITFYSHHHYPYYAFLLILTHYHTHYYFLFYYYFLLSSLLLIHSYSLLSYSYTHYHCFLFSGESPAAIQTSTGVTLSTFPCFYVFSYLHLLLSSLLLVAWAWPSVLGPPVLPSCGD